MHALEFLSSAQYKTDGYWTGQGAEHNLGTSSINDDNGNKFLHVSRPNTCATSYGFGLNRRMNSEKYKVYKASFEQKVKISEVTGAGMFFSYGVAENGWLRLCFVPNADGKIDVRYDAARSNGTNDTKIATIDLNNWYDIKTVFRCNGNDGSEGTAEFYLNGEFIGSTDAHDAETSPANCSVYAWNMHTFASAFVTADIDDVNIRVYTLK